MRRQRTICTIAMKKDGQYTVLSQYAAMVVQAGKYWWVRVATDVAIGPWQLVSHDQILELSDGQLG